MERLRSTAAYKSLAAEIAFQTEAYIDGKFAGALSGKTFDAIDPASGKVLARVASCGEEDVDAAVKAAREAFESGV